MKRIIYNKLVRDKIPEIIRENGGIPKTTKLKSRNFLNELKSKLIEESKEVFNTKNKKSLEEELADVLEVIESIVKAEKIKWGNINKIKTEKNKKRGSFKKRIFLKEVLE